MPGTKKSSGKKGKKGKSKASPKSLSSSSKKRPARSQKGAAKRAPSKAEGFARIIEVLKRHAHKLLGISGVRVIGQPRPGYRKVNNQITTQHAIVVTIDPRDRLKKDLIPKSLGGIPVDVRMATPLEQRRVSISEARGVLESVGPAVRMMENLALPGWDLMKDGEEAVGETDEEALEAVTAPRLPYKPPPDVELLKVKDKMRVLCHVSPDAGWATLSDFFQKVRKTLTVAMYDLSATHVVEGLKSAMTDATGKFRLILDPGLSVSGDTKKNDYQSESEVRDYLSDALGNRFDFLWAAVKKKGKVVQGIFPSAYHIKVAVSGGKSFWLSSGNWQSSNQPDLEALDKDAAFIQSNYNREWHVVIDHPGMASTYEKFIKWDMKQAAGVQDTTEGVASDEAMPELLVLQDSQESVAEAIQNPQTFEPKEFVFTAEKPLQVQPLLSPDNYAKQVKAVIKSAKKTLYFQNQYINVGKDPNREFTDLLDALLEKIKEGLDVKIILRKLPNADAQQEALQYYAEQNHGFSNIRIKFQSGSHTKGIVVDSKVVVVGSHNWSRQGVSENRDASLIFYNPEIAKYYEKVFLYDWENLAKLSHLSDEEMPILATEESVGDESVQGLARVPWDYFEDLS
jgi:sugar-specific transcriptional regulator TrmB